MIKHEESSCCVYIVPAISRISTKGKGTKNEIV